MRTLVIKTTATCAATHLDVFSGGNPAEAAAVELARVGEDHGLGWHVEPRREGLRGEQHLQGAALGFTTCPQ